MLRGGRWEQRNRSSPGPACALGSRRWAEARPGGRARKAKATWVPGRLMPAGPEGAAGRGVGRGRCGVPLTLRLPRTLARPSANTGRWPPPPQPRRTGARALDGKASQPFGAVACSEARRVRPRGHLAGRGKPSEGPSMRSGEGEAKCGKGACAV